MKFSLALNLPHIFGYSKVSKIIELKFWLFILRGNTYFPLFSLSLHTVQLNGQKILAFDSKTFNRTGRRYG